MYCEIYLKRIIPFFLTFLLAVYACNLFSLFAIPIESLEKKVSPPRLEKFLFQTKTAFDKENKGRGCSSCDLYQSRKKNCLVCKNGKNASTMVSPLPDDSNNSKSIQLISKPQPKYTEEAKTHLFQGSITLRVTFLANGKIGSITPINRLPYGLTEEAIEAAKKIKFKPAKSNGKPVAQSRRVQYQFTIY